MCAWKCFALAFGAEPANRLLDHSGEVVDAGHRGDQRPFTEEVERRPEHSGRRGQQDLIEAIGHLVDVSVAEESHRDVQVLDRDPLDALIAGPLEVGQ